jgi:hypothetical protein
MMQKDEDGAERGTGEKKGGGGGCGMEGGSRVQHGGGEGVLFFGLWLRLRGFAV